MVIDEDETVPDPIGSIIGTVPQSAIALDAGAESVLVAEHHARGVIITTTFQIAAQSVLRAERQAAGNIKSIITHIEPILAVGLRSPCETAQIIRSCTEERLVVDLRETGFNANQSATLALVAIPTENRMSMTAIFKSISTKP